MKRVSLFALVLVLCTGAVSDRGPAPQVVPPAREVVPLARYVPRNPDVFVSIKNPIHFVASLRDGKRALDLVMKVYRAKTVPTPAETLALALAEVGRCEEAATLQKQLVATAEQLKDGNLVEQLKKDLVRYEKGNPCRPPELRRQ